MSPEMIVAFPVTKATDIFSLGLMLLMLADSLPWYRRPFKVIFLLCSHRKVHVALCDAHMEIEREEREALVSFL